MRNRSGSFGRARPTVRASVAAAAFASAMCPGIVLCSEAIATSVARSELLCPIVSHLQDQLDARPALYYFSLRVRHAQDVPVLVSSKHFRREAGLDMHALETNGQPTVRRQFPEAHNDAVLDVEHSLLGSSGARYTSATNTAHCSGEAASVV